MPALVKNRRLDIHKVAQGTTNSKGVLKGYTEHPRIRALDVGLGGPFELSARRRSLNLTEHCQSVKALSISKDPLPVPPLRPSGGALKPTEVPCRRTEGLLTSQTVR